MTNPHDFLPPPLELPRKRKPPMPCTTACLSGKFELLEQRGETCVRDARVVVLEQANDALRKKVSDLETALRDTERALEGSERVRAEISAAIDEERERLAQRFLRTPDQSISCRLAAAIVRFVPTGPPLPLGPKDLEWAQAVAAAFLSREYEPSAPDVAVIPSQVQVQIPTAYPGAATPTGPIMRDGFATETGPLLSDPLRAI